LGLVKRLVRIRASNFKVLITSATLDGEKVSEFFSGCPVLNVPGKLYPVEILYSKERPVSYIESSLKVAIGMFKLECFCCQVNLIWLILLVSLLTVCFLCYMTKNLVVTCRYTCS